MAAQNTVAVLTEAPDKKEEWWNALGELHKQVKAAGDDDFAAFLDALRRLVEGTRPESLGDRVPAPFREAWEAVVRGAGAIHEWDSRIHELTPLHRLFR